jgi:hypothetical protein
MVPVPENRVVLFAYEDLTHVEEGDSDGIGCVEPYLKKLGKVYRIRAPCKFKDDEDAFNYDGQHVSHRVFQKIEKAAVKTQPGGVAFIVLSGHGTESAIGIGHPNANGLKPEHVQEAFFAEQHSRAELSGKQPEPVTVVLILNCCSSPGGIGWKNPPAQLSKNSKLFKNCCCPEDESTHAVGQDWVRWAVVRPERCCPASMKKQLVPCFFQAFAEDKSLLRALSVSDCLGPRMHKRAQHQGLPFPKVRVLGAEQWDVDLQSRGGKLCLTPVTRTFTAQGQDTQEHIVKLALEQRLQAVTKQFEAVTKQFEQERMIKMSLPQRLQAATEQKLALEQQLQMLQRTVEQAAEQPQQELPMAEGHPMPFHRPSQTALPADANACVRPREDLSDSGRGGDKRKRSKSLCEAYVNNGYGQCTRFGTHPTELCLQHSMCKGVVRVQDIKADFQSRASWS